MSATSTDAKELMTKTDTIKLRNRHIGKSCKLFYQTDPLKIVSGKGQYMFDEEGTKYLDCINNVAHVGHCHPKIVEAGAKQMSLLSTNNRFLHDELVTCAQMLTSKMPGDLSVCYFVNSGSEANDLALRLARTYTGQKDVITLNHAYHGHLTAVMEISPYKFNQPGGDPKPDYIHVASCPDTYRGKFNVNMHGESNLSELYANEVAELICKIKENGKGIAAFIAESLQSCGGQIIPPTGYFDNIYRLVRDAGGVVIADEVQVGFGRVGSCYWAFELQNVIPDIVTVAKPMGNGHPVGAVVTTQKIAETFAASGISYFNTYGGNPVSCAIANAVMRVIDNEKLQENARMVGEYLVKKCILLKEEFDLIGDVRGVGLFVGIEMIRHKDTKEPATNEAGMIVDRLKNVHHIIVSSDGPDDNVIKLKPPMVFNLDDANTFLVGFMECLSYVEGNKKKIIQGSVCNLSTNIINESSDLLVKSI